MDRVRGQMAAAFAELESELQREPLECDTESITQAGVTVAVVWSFMQMKLPEAAPAARHAALDSFTTRAEALPAFLALPQR